MLGFYNRSVILTYVSLIFAAFGISFALSNEPNAAFGALICLMFSGICDMFDGAIAQRCKRSEEEKLFGIEIDSLCDLVAFGGLPAVLTIRLTNGSIFGTVAGAILLLSSVIRLAFFNVQEIRRDRSQKRDVYLGMPVTLVAIFFPLCLSLCVPLNLSPATLAPYFLIAFAALEVSRIPLKKPYGVAKLFLLAVGVGVFVCVCLFGTKITL